MFGHAVITVACLWAAGWTAQTLAAPQLSERAVKSRNYTATFEYPDLSGGPTLPGAYDALYYGHFVTGPFDEMAGFCSGVCAESFPAEAAFSGGSGAPPASMSIFYPQSNVTYFHLGNFYFGCGGGGYYVYNCTLTAKGYKNTNRRFPKASLKPDYEESFVYSVHPGTNAHTGAPAAGMIQAAPKGWTGLKAVTFSAVLIPPSNQSFQVLMDNINYVATNVTK